MHTFIIEPINDVFAETPCFSMGLAKQKTRALALHYTGSNIMAEAKINYTLYPTINRGVISYRYALLR